MKFPRLWSPTRRSVFDFVRSQLPLKLADGSLPDDEVFNKGKQFRWVAGGADGALGHHGNSRSDIQAKELLAALKAAVHEANDGSIRRLYDLLIEDHTIGFIDTFLIFVAEDPVARAPELAEVARWLATEAPDRGAVKFGITLLGRCGDAGDADVFMILGRHEEFTLYAAMALRETLVDPEPALWELAKQVHGWGRIQIVKRLGATTDEAIKRWMLREGYKNRVMYEYLAHCCATTGGLLAALQDPYPDDALLLGAGEIIDALIRGGPAQDMDDYTDGADAVRLYLEHTVQRSSTNVRQFAILQAIGAYVGDPSTDWSGPAKRRWTESTRREIANKSAAILARDEWREIGRQGLLSDDDFTFRSAASVLEALGFDIWDVRLERQVSRKSDEWYWLMKTDDPSRVAKVIGLAEEQLDLDGIASGPKDELGLGREFHQHRMLDWLLQGLSRFPGEGTRLVVTALKSPVTRNRNLAVRVLENWRREAWPHEMSALLERAVADEPNSQLCQRIRNLLDGRSLDDEVIATRQTLH